MKDVIYYLRKDLSEGKAQISTKIINNSIEASFNDDEGRSGKLASESYFQLLWQLQDFYSRHEAQILCTGLLNDVYPGGQASSSTFGRSAYRIVEEDQTKEVIDIFKRIQPAEIIRLSTKEDQKKSREAVLRNNNVGRFALLGTKKANLDVQQAINDVLNDTAKKHNKAMKE